MTIYCNYEHRMLMFNVVVNINDKAGSKLGGPFSFHVLFHGIGIF